MPAVLRISGPYERLRKSLLEVPFPFKEAIWSTKDRERSESPDECIVTFNLTISDADGDRVPVQINESLQFLTQNKVAIARMRELPGVESVGVDFSWDFPLTGGAQFNCFQHPFVSLCGTLGIDIEVSVYGVSVEASD